MKVVAEILIGFTPVGVLLDIRDLVKAGLAVRDGKGGWAPVAMSAVGFVPLVGDTGKLLVRHCDELFEISVTLAKHVPLAKATEQADAARQLAVKAAQAVDETGRKQGAVAVLVTAKGETVVGVSREVHEIAQHPKVTAALMATPPNRRASFHGGCAEVACIDKALHAGYDLEGAQIIALNLAGNVNVAALDSHKSACGTCGWLLDHFGIIEMLK